MSLRATLLLLVLALGLGAWVWFVEVVGKREQAEQEAAAKRLLAFDPEAVRRLALPLEEGGEAALVRDASDPERWRLEAPLDFRADGVVVRGILSGLEELEAEATLARPDDLAPFGLAEGRRELRVETGAEGAAPLVLWLGGPAPIGETRYLALASDPNHVFTVSAADARVLNPRLNSLRDKRITTLELDGVTGFALREGRALIVEARRLPPAGEAAEPPPAEATPPAAPAEEPSWELVAPLADRADTAAVRRALESLVYARASDFVDEPGPPAEYGLAPPELEVELQRADGPPQRLALGRAQQKAYARVDGGLPIFELPERILSDLPRELFLYRFKQVLKLDELAVRRLELEFPRDATRYVFTRDENQWRPEGSELRVESLEIEDILYAVRALEATGIVDASVPLAALGLEPARVRLTARDAEGAQLGWVELGDPDAASGLAARSSQSERLWRVANDLGREVPLGEEAFRNRWVKPEPAATAPSGEPAEGEPGAEAPEAAGAP